MIIYENKTIKIEKEQSSIPWLKVFAKEPCKELSNCSKKTRTMLYYYIETIEEVMINYYNPDKINIASFGNYVPQVHIHIQARFKNDEWFPEPTWGKSQRKSNLDLPKFEIFIQKLLEKLDDQ
jgi:diadenosine tetraphosphate (Ap4A) HIT family hydrolase